MKPLLRSLLLLFVVSSASGQMAPYVKTLATTTPLTSTADGVPYSQSYVEPVGIVKDASGNIYWTSGQQVKKANASDGIISTLVGFPAPPPPSFQVPYLTGITYDPAGYLYVAENTSRKIKRITLSNLAITDIAGNGSTTPSGADGSAALSAGLDNLNDIVYSNGSVYTVEPNRIRRINLSTGTIHNVAGTGVGGFSGDGGAATSAQISTPVDFGGIAFDGSLNMYIGDALNQRIRKVTTAGIISTFAGTGVMGGAGDGGAPLSAQFAYPRGMGFDNSGNLYIHDVFNYKVRKISGGIVSTLAPAPVPYRIGFWPETSGSMLVSFPDRLTRITTGGALQSLTLQKGSPDPAINSPSDAVADAAGNIYVADKMAYRVRKIDAITKQVTTILGTGWNGTTVNGVQGTSTDISSPVNLLLDGSGNLYVSTKLILKLNLSTGIVTVFAGGGGSTANGVPATSAYVEPRGMTLDASGNLYFAEYYKVRKIDAITGLISTIAGNGTGSGCDFCDALTASVTDAVDVAVVGQQIFIAEFNGRRIRMIDTSLPTPILSTIAGLGSSTYDGPASAVGFVSGLFVKDGIVYFMDHGLGTPRVRYLTWVPPVPPAPPFPAQPGYWSVTTIPPTTTPPGTTFFNDFSILSSGAILTSNSLGIYKLRVNVTITETLTPLVYNGLPQYPILSVTPAGAPLTFSFNVHGQAMIFNSVKDAGVYDYVATSDTDDFYGTLSRQNMIINRLTLTMTANDASRNYGYANPTFGYTYSGLLAGEDPVAVLGTPVPFVYPVNATITSPPGTYALTVQVNYQPTNYTVSVVQGVLTINKAPLTVSATYLVRTYGDANPTLTFSYSGFVNGETAASVVTAAPSIATTATLTSPVGVVPITLSGGTTNANYIFVYLNATLTINKALITATAQPASRTYGAANPTFTFLYTGFKNGETASVFLSAPTASTSAIGTSPPTTYSIIALGGNAANYSFSLVNGTLTVTKANLTITAQNASKVYGAVMPTITVAYTGFVNGETSTVLTPQPTVSTAATTVSSVGTYTLTPSGAASANYNLAYVNGTLTINKATLTATADNKTRLYGDANPALTITYTGFVNGDTQGTAMTAAPAAATTAIATSNVGNYPIIVSGGTSSNYSFAYTNGNFAITKAPLSATAQPTTRSYGVANPTFPFVYSGFKNGETSSVVTTPPVFSTAAIAATPVGTYSINGTGGVATNYTITCFTGQLTITKASLTITADDKSRQYGIVNPAFTIAYSGFVNAETATVLTTQATATTSATASTGAGSYSIVPSGAAAVNYAFTYVNGALTINKAALTATADNQSRLYGQANPSFTVSYTGLVNGDSPATAVSVTPAVTTGATSTSAVGTYSLTTSGGTSANYTFNYNSIGVITISKNTLTVTAPTLSKVYGQTNPTLTPIYSGFMNGETSAVLTSLPTMSTTATASSTVGTYPTTASGGSATNYTLTYVQGVLNITKATLTVTGNNFSRTYGVANPTFTYVITGYVNGDNVSSISTVPIASTSATTGSSPGNYTIMLSGGSAANYDFNYVTGTLTVTAASQTISFNSITPICNTLGGVTLTASATSGLPVSFSSSNPSIASVSGNTLTFNAYGTVTVTAMQSGNPNYAAAANVLKTASAGSNVGSINKTGDLCTPGYVVLTAGPGTGYSWSPSGGTTRSITVYTATTYYVTYTNSGCTVNASIVVPAPGAQCQRTMSDDGTELPTVEGLVDEGLTPIGVGLFPGVPFENSDEGPDVFIELKVFPIPASKELNIVLPQKATIDTEVGLYDQTGKKIINGMIRTGKRSITMNVEDIPTSVYIVRLGGETITFQKVMIIKRE